MSANRESVWQPGKLWSLWDMIELDGGKFALDFQAITSLGQDWLSTSGAGRKAYDAEALRLIKGHAADLKLACERLEIPGAIGSLDRILGFLPQFTTEVPGNPGFFGLPDDGAAHRFGAAVAEVGGRIQDEMQGRPFLGLTVVEAALFGKEAPFGEDVERAFADTIEDVSEASKCLALSRYTATVFHLMRALERATQRVADTIGATITDEHGRHLAWGVIAENMRPKIDAMKKGSDQQVNWYRVQQNLVAVNRAWRVPTNHPKQTYTAEEAQNVFNSTKAFMQELAPLV